MHNNLFVMTLQKVIMFYVYPYSFITKCTGKPTDVKLVQSWYTNAGVPFETFYISLKVKQS